MSRLTEKEQLQDDNYEFPYHYIPSFDNENFSQVKTLRWGYEYLSYIRFVLEKLKTWKFESLLDVGCGDGRFLYEVSRCFSHKRLVGLDYSQRAIRHAIALHPDIEFICGDLTDTSLLRDRFDIITLIETLEHIPPPHIRSFAKGLHYYLKGDGRLMITVPSKNVGLNPKHYQHFDLESLSGVLEPFFAILEHYFINRMSIWTNLLERLLVNRFFILNEPHLLNKIYNGYERYLLPAEENNAVRICAVCRKK